MGKAISEPLQVMQSFGAPRPTSNPYIHMLDDALAKESSVQHLRFDRRRALFGRYDVIHFHWPETLFDGSSPSRRFVKRLYAAALMARLQFCRIAVVRTVHNLELPQDITPWERRLLRQIERLTTHRIVLNAQTMLPNTPHSLIRHGDFVSWFARYARNEPKPSCIGFVGLIRRYKGLEQLLDAFHTTEDSALTLQIAGNPTSDDIRRDVQQRADADPRICIDLRYLSEADFVGAVTSAGGIVLPYSSMHNSGTVLAALSLSRPVLVPANEVNAALAAEVGPGWVHQFAGPLQAADLMRFDHALKSRPSNPPHFAGRSWDSVGAAHAQAYREALKALRRGRVHAE